MPSLLSHISCTAAACHAVRPEPAGSLLTQCPGGVQPACNTWATSRLHVWLYLEPSVPIGQVVSATLAVHSYPDTGSTTASMAAPDPGTPAAQVMRKEPTGGRASHLLVPLATLVSSGLLGAVSGILLGLQVGGSASGRRWPAVVKRLPIPAQKW